MDKRDLLIYILGYLRSLHSMSKVSKEKVILIKTFIDDYNEIEQREKDRFHRNPEDYDPAEHYKGTIYEYPHYDEDADLDQQSPDFDL
ncbi:hypothetical protein LS48_06425 [Aequorivita aquimaris]|uniref:Uncharacterized protein n=1 Tax=Aequorivita aquimaris TaxID=1548749 RepID=A0A137RIT9_9FLAO|nr:hypothetical protein [Aequorivita aquimaris]KXO00103.1 hypothetical protein LS48_06425 [Aequorivita aquimaris]